MKPLWHKDDIGAATVGALATLPQAVAYGLIVVSPLGAEWAAFGISVSVATAIAYGFFTGLFTTHPFMVSGPKAVLALVIAAGIQSALDRGETPENALLLGFTGVIVAGVFQIGSGVLRLGHVVSYVPVPVLAGFMNASALLVMLSSVPMVLGVPEMTVEQLLAGGIVDASLWALGVSGLTIIVNFLAEGRVRFLPAALIGLIAGAAVYYAGIKGLDLPQGPEVGHIDLASLLQLPMLFTHADPMAVLMRAPDIPLLTGLSIGLLTSFDTVLSSGSLNIDDGGKPDANRDLRVHGAANFLMGVLGYMPGSGTLSRSMAIINAGAKTRAANAGVGIVFLIMLVVLAPVVAALPLWATAGMLLATAVQALDKGTLANIRRIVRREVPYPRILAGDLAVTFVVVVTALIFNLIAAVGVGIVLAVVLFVLGVGRNPVRRVLLGSRVRSKVQRRPEQISLLEQEGHRIAVIEVQGALFFGACAQLQSVAERQIALGAAYLILDFRHVTSIDSIGTALLRTLNIQCREQGGRLSLSYIQPERRLKIVEQRRDENGSETEDLRRPTILRWLWLSLHANGVVDALGEDAIFDDTEKALGDAEERLLSRLGRSSELSPRGIIASSPILAGLTREQVRSLGRFARRQTFLKEEAVFSQGEVGDMAYLMVRGRMDVSIDIPGSNRKRRVSSLAEGTMFGEMGLLDGEKRSATVRATQASRCFSIGRDEFDALRREYPDIALLLMQNLGRQFAERLRLANNIISELEH